MPSSQLRRLQSHLSRYHDASTQLTAAASGGWRSPRCNPRFPAARLSLRASLHTRSQKSRTSFTTSPNVDATSLKNTLRAHREANRAPIIRKYDKDGWNVRVRDSEGEIPSRRVTTPTRPKSPRRVRLPPFSPQQQSKGTSREIIALWRVDEDDETLLTRFRLPWLSHLEDDVPNISVTAVDRLSAEIRAFEKYNSPSQEEQDTADLALQDIVEAVKHTGDSLDVDVIGSRATGTADPLSDIDVNVWTPETSATPHTTPDVLAELSTFLEFRQKSNSPHSSPIEFVMHLKDARVPILVCQHKASGLPIQVQSTPRTYDSTEYVKACLKEYPTLRGLFKVLKQLLRMRGLNVGTHGGITSYPLFVMIVAALKFSEGRFHSTDAGNQLLFFFDMYTEINFSSHGISTRPLQIFSKAQARGWKKSPDHAEGSVVMAEDFERELAGRRSICFRALKAKKDQVMTLQDPTNPLHDLGVSTFSINDVQETFIRIHHKLKQAMADWDEEMPRPSSLGPPRRAKSLLEPCVGGDYRIYESDRDDLRLNWNLAASKAGKSGADDVDSCTTI